MEDKEELGDSISSKDLSPGSVQQHVESTDCTDGSKSTEGTESTDGVPAIKESREEMLARHRKETKELQHKDIQLKKEAAKGSKNEQKAKKKAIDEEIARLDAKMKSRQTKELASLGFFKVSEEEEEDISSSSSSKLHKVKEDVVNLAKAVAGISSLGGSEKIQKVSKAQKRRDKKMKEEVERDQRILEENSSIVSEREREDRLLREKLEPLGLTLKEIKPDGHCLYRAVEDQLSLGGGGGGGGGGEGGRGGVGGVGEGENGYYDYKQIRGLAASYMRENSERFLPFVISEFGEEGGPGTDEDPTVRFEKYCCSVESTASWGGQLELEALANALKRHITVIAAELPDVHMGTQFGNSTMGDGRKGKGKGKVFPPIRLSYHKHEYGLGEHYNSVVPHTTLL